MIGAANLAEELARESSAFDADRIVRLDATQLARRPCRRKVPGEPTCDELTQHGVETTDRSGAMRDQVMVTFREEPQHRRVILEPNDPQSRVPQRDDRSRAGIVRVGLVTASIVEQPHPRGERRRHVEHRLTDRDELLGQQRAGARRAFDRPTPRFERRREVEQSIALRTISTNTDFAHQLFVSIEHRRSVRRLVWIDTNEEHAEPPRRTTRIRDTPAGSPEEGVPFLFRATPKPRSSGRTVRSKANRERWQGILETAHRTPRRYGNTRRACITSSFRAIWLGPRLNSGAGSDRCEQPTNCGGSSRRDSVVGDGWPGST